MNNFGEMSSAEWAVGKREKTRTIVAGGSQFERSRELKIFFLRRSKIYRLRKSRKLIKYGQLSWKPSRTFKRHGSVTTALSSTVSTNGSRNAISLMHE